MKQTELRHPTKLARGLGSAHDGVGHWWAQRITAIAMIPLGTWIVYMLVAMMRAGQPLHVKTWLSDPLAAFPLALMLVLMFYHAKLGLQVVIEDYFHCPRWKYSLLILNTLICLLGASMSLLAILKLHLG